MLTLPQFTGSQEKNPALVEAELGNRENDDDANSEDDGGYGAFFAICLVKYFILQ